MIIYKITNIITGKIYIGQTTKDLDYRWKTHCLNKRHTAIAAAIRSYGKENFTIEIIDGANNLSELNYKEQHHIYINNTISPNGYNLVPGGRNFTHCEETLKKLRKPKNWKNGPPRLGVKHTQETKDKIRKTRSERSYIWTEEMRKECSVRNRGRKHTEASKIKISDSNKGISRGLGTKRSEEHKAAISKAHKGRKYSQEHCDKMSKIRKGFDSPARKVAREISNKRKLFNIIVINLKTKEETVHLGIGTAAEYAGVDASNVSRVLNGKKTECKGWTFKRYED